MFLTRAFLRVFPAVEWTGPGALRETAALKSSQIQLLHFVLALYDRQGQPVEIEENLFCRICGKREGEFPERASS